MATRILYFYIVVSVSMLMYKDLLPIKQFCLITIPKCGTNLVSGILERVAGKKAVDVAGGNDFLYFPPMKQFININYGKHFFRSHAFYREDLYQALTKAGVFIIFVQRDPRDMIASFSRYRRRFKNFGRLSPKEISLNVLISDFILSPGEWMTIPGQKYHQKVSQIATNIKTLYGAYFEWTQKDNVFVLRYEDLLGGNEASLEKKVYTLQELFDFIDLKISYEKIRDVAVSMDDMKPHTFTAGQKIGRWKQFFTEEHRRQFDTVADGLLELFGYA